ncbi:MAG TPA: prolipoprotein diacylglyceryl transferase family protein [Terracidiphilus sp.]|nr:prolipoprotein diacylglyceryl transferase family protein [Terracidiphilus sp.]
MYPVLFHIGALIVPSYGVLSALGVLLGLALLLRTARIAGLDPNQLWNLCIVALFAALVGSRLLLVALNWTILRSHPAWLLGLAMIHHPLLAAAGSVFALAAAVPYARRQQLPLRSTADALAAPLCLGLAFEQIGALLAGSGYGRETDVRWAVVYTHPLAARWSGTPLFLPVHPVQAYAGCAFLLIAVALLLFMPRIRQEGDIFGAGLMAVSAAVYFTEFWRDSEGRGTILHGALDGPQWVAIVLFLAGAFVLRERPEAQIEDETVVAEPAHRIEAPHE